MEQSLGSAWPLIYRGGSRILQSGGLQAMIMYKLYYIYIAIIHIIILKQSALYPTENY